MKKYIVIFFLFTIISMIFIYTNNQSNYIPQKNKFDYIIIGCGPGGIQMGHFFEKNNIDYVILEKNNKAGSFFEKFPRHGKLISINKVHTGTDNPEFNLRHDWNSLLSYKSVKKPLLFKDYSSNYFPKRQHLVNYLNGFSKGLNIVYNEEINLIEKCKNNGFNYSIKSRKKTYYCKYLILATGWNRENIPNIEKGGEFIIPYGTISTNPKDYTNKRIMIIGGGNSAFETAENLLEDTQYIHLNYKSPANFAWETHYPGNLRSVNSTFIDSYLLKSMNIIDRSVSSFVEVKNEKEGLGYYFLDKAEKLYNKNYDMIISCTGFKTNTDYFHKDCVPDIVYNKLPNLTEEYESINNDHMYFAGAMMHCHDYKKSTGGFIHGFRYYCKALFKILMIKNHNKNWDDIVMFQSINFEKIAKCMLDRINNSSGLFQCFGQLFDIYLIIGDKIKMYKEVPKKYIKKIVNNNDYFSVSLEYANNAAPNPFNNEIVKNIKNMDESVFLHPVIRFKFDETVRLLESPTNEWPEKENSKKIQNWLKNCINKIK